MPMWNTEMFTIMHPRDVHVLDNPTVSLIGTRPDGDKVDSLPLPYQALVNAAYTEQPVTFTDKYDPERSFTMSATAVREFVGEMVRDQHLTRIYSLPAEEYYKRFVWKPWADRHRQPETTAP